MSIRRALLLTLLWVLLALAFGVYVWSRLGSVAALQYATAYLTEWSLSIDNIFVFVLLFRFFQVSEKDTPRALTAGIILAIVFRIGFIAGGLALIQKAHWVLYIFGAFLVYTGVKMFTTKGHEQNTGDGKINRVLKKLIKNPFALIVVTLALTDVVFALDSIPAILAISTIPLVAYGSNIFAVMGLRSLFFLLKGAVDRFRYLQQGVAAVLVFIGAKMLAGMIPLHLPEWASLLVIGACLGGSILLSIKKRPT
ncbi:MAG TPA: hypothetical protein VL547_20310 [Dinghuibacter sp.]|uniref:TerC family protein n=1 Tax=Dinghuibacter sp. TaxID=2024697 RepID=UPI002C5640DD|nr:tellurium resistance protein TerC [Dinghuibacter sp.]HTJ14399.1 hypothetical protein [Dinghuibacter sp.]